MEIDLLIIATKGPELPNDATLPFFLAKAAQESKRRVAVVLASDASPLAVSEARDGVQGVGFPPFKELYAFARDHEIPIYL